MTAETLTLPARLWTRFARAPMDRGRSKDEVAAHYRRVAAQTSEEALTGLGSTIGGLDEAEAGRRLAAVGPNSVAPETRHGTLRLLARHLWTPLNALLLGLAAVSVVLGDARAALMIGIMVLLSVGLSFLQEYRSSKAAAELRAMVHTTASILRRRDGSAAPVARAAATDHQPLEVPIERLVPGDIVLLAAGDMIPADLRLIASKSLFVNQATLTGEALPAEKLAAPCGQDLPNPLEATNLCFMGTNVVSGSGTGLVMLTGSSTFFGHVAETVAHRRPPTSFETGVNRFVWLLVAFMAVMVPSVLVINLATKGDWFEALLFAVAVGVGLTPEMLPMIVTVNLAKGALAMSRKKVIVKRLNAIQNFGAMDVLCTDKTGTLTQDRIILKRHLDLRGADSDRVLEYAFLNSYYQSGLKNLLDVAVLREIELHHELRVEHDFRKIDEIPFDFERRRMSVVVAHGGQHVLICKGAIEETMAACSSCEIDGVAGPLDPSHLAAAREETARLSADGFRVVAVAYRQFPLGKEAYRVADENELTLLGYIAFLDPPKDSAARALAALRESGLQVKILTGDNDIVTRKICSEVGIPVDRVVLGSEIEALSPAALARTVEAANVFAKLSPAQKAVVVRALRSNGHVIGFLGDGINDGPALSAADVGISVDTAVDIAKETADIILLEKSLSILHDGVIEGRRVFGNIVKYIKMGASSNFGNMFSVIGASIFLPFLPMAPIQVLANNLLYDFSQTAIPTDNVDAEYLAAPRRWSIGDITRFMLIMGPISSIFDYVTFSVMLFVFDAAADPALFQTGWFVESLLTQTLIIHVIRTAKIPFVESQASRELMATSAIVGLVGMMLPFTALGSALGFVPLPIGYWPILGAILLGYITLAHLTKTWVVRRFGMN